MLTKIKQISETEGEKSQQQAKFSTQKSESGAWQMDQRLNAALPKERAQVQHLHSGQHLSVNFSSWGFNSLFWPLWASGTNVVYIHMCSQTNIHIKKRCLNKMKNLLRVLIRKKSIPISGMIQWSNILNSTKRILD